MSESIRVDEVPVIRAVEVSRLSIAGSTGRYSVWRLCCLEIVPLARSLRRMPVSGDALGVGRVAKMRISRCVSKRVVVNRSVSRFRRLTAEGKALVRFRSSPVDHEGLGVEVG